jgi:uncharacterized protein YgiM (DUF1202 family)
MYKNSIIKRVSALTICGAMIFTCGISSANTTMVASEESIAGFSMPLDRFVLAEVESGVIGPVADDTQAETNGPDNNILPSESTIVTTDVENSDDEGDEDEPIDEHVKLNLNYDRLGIADVDNYLNVRAKASTNAKIVGKLTKHAGCHIYNIKKGWAKIVSGKVKGYVKAEYLVTDEEAESMAMKVGKKVATVLEEGLRVRALPSTDASIYSVLSKDEDFEIHKEKLNSEWLDKFIKKHVSKKQVKRVDMDTIGQDLDNWVCISVDNDYAFVAKEYVEISYKLNRAVKIGELATDGSSGVSSTRASIVEYAKQFLGNRYVYGGTSLTNGTDCSGFSMGVFAHFGIGLPRTSGSQAAASRGIKSSEAKPGDLFFYGGSGHVSHVAIYIGSGMVIHASNPRSGIKISNAYYRSPIKIGRVISD